MGGRTASPTRPRARDRNRTPTGGPRWIVARARQDGLRRRRPTSRHRDIGGPWPLAVFPGELVPILLDPYRCIPYTEISPAFPLSAPLPPHRFQNLPDP